MLLYSKIKALSCGYFCAIAVWLKHTYIDILCYWSPFQISWPLVLLALQDAGETRKPWGLPRPGGPQGWLYVRHPRLPCLRQPRDPQRFHALFRQDGRHVEPRGHAVHHAGRPLPLPRPGPGHTFFQNSQRPVLFAWRFVSQGQVSAPEPAEERTLWETHSNWAARSPVVPRAAIVPGSGAGWPGSKLGRTNGAILWCGRGRRPLLLTDSIWVWLRDQNKLWGIHCCFVFVVLLVFFTLALFRNPFVYCCVYIHPQAFYKILLYCILLSYTCYSLRALFTMITHCVSVCVIWKLFGARRINHDRNKPDRVFKKKKKISTGFSESVTGI